jgi:hypothetical protein
MERNDLILIAGIVKSALALSYALMAEGHHRDLEDASS